MARDFDLLSVPFHLWGWILMLNKQHGSQSPSAGRKTERTGLLWQGQENAYPLLLLTYEWRSRTASPAMRQHINHNSNSSITADRTHATTINRVNYNTELTTHKSGLIRFWCILNYHIWEWKLHLHIVWDDLHLQQLGPIICSD